MLSGLSPHHDRGYVAALDAERRRRMPRRRRPLTSTDLDEIVRAATSGDADAWAALHARYGARVRSIAFKHRLTAMEIDDVVQNTWLRLLQHIGSIRDPQAIGAWLETTARRESLRLLAAGKREISTENEHFDEAPAPDAPELLAHEERNAAIVAALSKLPVRHAAMMRMLVSDPTPSYAEIARTLDMPVGSIGPIRARSIARLRRDGVLLEALV